MGSWRSSRSTRRDQISELPRTKRRMSWSEETPGFPDTPQQVMPARREASHGNRDEPSQSGRVKRATGRGKQPQEVPCEPVSGRALVAARRRLATSVQEEWQPSTEPGLQGIWSQASRGENRQTRTARPMGSESRSVAQPGSAPRLGRGGRRFESCHSDHPGSRSLRTRREAGKALTDLAGGRGGIGRRSRPKPGRVFPLRVRISPSAPKSGCTNMEGWQSLVECARLESG